MSPPHHIVLVGGGHAHVQVLTDFAAEPEAGIRLTLVSDQASTPYSGMLPGHVAGHYSRDEMHVDLVRLARATGTRLVLAAATGLDPQARLLSIGDAPPLPYDTLSLDVGITPDLAAVAGADRHGIAVKPIGRLLPRLDALLSAAAEPEGPRRIAIVGGGAAGVELAFAMRARLMQEAARHGLDPAAFSVTLVSATQLVPSSNAGVRRRVTAALAAKGIATLTGFRAVRIDERGVTAQDGRELAVDAALFSTAARAPAWLAATGLTLARDGSVETLATLQACGRDAIFAVGDCATVVYAPRPKAGVYAVRHGPVLARNLRARVRGEPLEDYRAQRDYLTLIATGDGRAIAGRGHWLAFEGRLAWLWKDRIDRHFMARFAIG